MSMVSGLRGEPDDMWAWCPACGEIVYIDEDDFWQTLDDGNPEYEVTCVCGQSFYVSKSYD